MKTVFIFSMALMISSTSYASGTLTLKTPVSTRKELIEKIVVEDAPASSLTIYSETMSCKIKDLSLDEARSLQSELSAKTDVRVGIHCLGKAKTNARGVAVVTSRYNLGNEITK